MNELISRLEVATAPDPHLDAEIEAAINGGIPAYRCSDSTRRSYGPGAVHSRDDGSNINLGTWHSAPTFTGSLDAAVTLVPEGHRWLLDKRPFGSQRQDGYRAEVYRQAHGYLSDRSDVPAHWGPTPALALTTAALKARAAGVA